MLENLLYEKKGAIAYVTLNRPKVLTLSINEHGRTCERLLRMRGTMLRCAALS